MKLMGSKKNKINLLTTLIISYTFSKKLTAEDALSFPPISFIVA